MYATLRRPALVVLAALLPTAAAYGAEASTSVFLATDFNFGKAVRGAVVDHEFRVKNVGPGPIAISRVSVTPPLRITHMPARVAPGREGGIRVRLDTAGMGGPFEGEIRVELTDPARPVARLTFEGVIVSPVEVTSPSAFFLSARRGDDVRQASLEIINHEQEPVRIERIETPSERFALALETLEDGRRYRLTARLNPDGPGGKARATVLVATSSRSTPELRIPVLTYLRERVYTFPDAVDLGVLRRSDLVRASGHAMLMAQTLMVYGPPDFRINLRTDVPALDLSAERGPAGDRHQVTITVREEHLRAGAGRIDGSIYIQTDDPQFPSLTVPVSGVILER